MPSSESLTEGFVRAESEQLNDAVQSLEMRTPLGTTDLNAALSAAIDATQNAGDTAPTSIIYIGDGFSSNRFTQKRMTELVAALVENRISVHAVVLGPRTNPRFPSVLANLTGGTFTSLQRGQEKTVARELAAAATVAPRSASAVTVDGTALNFVNRDNFFLRPERHTVLLGQGQIPKFQTITIESNGQKLASVGVENTRRENAGAELMHLTKALSDSAGLDCHAPCRN